VWKAVILFVMLSIGCTASSNSYGSKYESDDNTFLIHNRTGSVLRISTIPNNHYLGRVTPGTHCVSLDKVRTNTTGFMFRATGGDQVRTTYTIANQAVWGTNWEIILGPQPNSWHYDVMRTFQPMRKKCK